MEPSRAVPESSKGMWASKLSLRIISVIFCIVLIGVSASADSQYANYSILFFAPPAAVGALWDIAEGIAILARKGHRGIHPGACVGLDLLLWLGFLASGIVFLLFGYVFDWGNDYYGDYGDYLGYGDLDYNFNNSSYSTYLGLNRAIIGFAFLLTVIHFVLFVLACVETSRRNRSTVVVYQPAPHNAQSVAVPHGSYHPQSVIMTPGSFQQQPMAVPHSYQPQTGYPPHQMPTHEAGYYKTEPDTTVVTPPLAPSPVYHGR